MTERTELVHADGITNDTRAVQAFLDGRIIGRADGGKTMAPGDYIARVKEQDPGFDLSGNGHHMRMMPPRA